MDSVDVSSVWRGGTAVFICDIIPVQLKPVFELLGYVRPRMNRCRILNHSRNSGRYSAPETSLVPSIMPASWRSSLGDRSRLRERLGVMRAKVRRGARRYRRYFCWIGLRNSGQWWAPELKNGDQILNDKNGDNASRTERIRVVDPPMGRFLRY